MSDVSNFRREKDQFFASDPESPLTPEQRQDFDGLKYFPEDSRLRYEIQVERIQSAEPIQMQTSTGDVQEYHRHSRLRFVVDGQPAQLTLFEGPNGFFLPFVDALSGEETYAAGRYVEPEQLADDRFLVDFNLAYNPYCAYNANWSCPLTPRENRLNVPIRAGERLFADSH
jgi:uncharacterized protein (DUF1684 family)